MSSMLSTIDTQIKFLRKACGSFGKRSLKDKLTESENMLAQIKAKKKNAPVDLIKLLDPFFHAVEIDENKYYMTAISCYTAIFKSKPEKGYIDVPVLDSILKSLFIIDKFPIEENRIKAANCIIACISSISAKMFIHGSVLLFMFEYLLNLYNTATLPESRDSVGKVINQLVDYYLGNYGKPPVIPHFETIEAMTSTVSDIICNNSLIISKYCPKNPECTINDIDIIMIIRAFCAKIGKGSSATSLLCTKVIQQILSLQTPFVTAPFFIGELRTTIHVALLSLCLDSNEALAKPTAEMILTIWRRFPQFYNEGLNEVLDQGLATALVSPSPKMMIRSFRLYSYLVMNPQFMVDSFVNYDCDDGGIFHNIFENTVNIIVKRSYPEQATDQIQKEALTTLLIILKNLWKYYTELSTNSQSETTETVAESVMSQKKAKNQIERAQEIFKKSPNKALKYFSTHNMCKDTPQSYADFLFNTGWLDPTGVGEIIGGSKPLNLEILPLFVNHFNFKGQSFEGAFRAFLSKFRIPGESQMIDRIMQEFGTKFYNDNSSLFSCADTVYVLAYSTLMLHTDAHHPTITNHMTLDEFIRNNRGIDNGKDLPVQFLTDLYKGITSKKINLSGNNLTSIPINNITLLSQKQQAELFKERSKHTLEVARQRTTTELHENRFHQAKSPLLIGPMFQCVWGGIIAALSMSFEMTEDEELVKLCLLGFQYSTHIASHCYIEDALETLVDSFAKFTRLRTYSTQLKPKNFLCTQALLKCAVDDREYLKGAWSIILGECSALDKMSTNKMFETDLMVINPLFQKSGSLDRESIKDFVHALCGITTEEMKEKPPRYTMLHNMETVASLNMEVRTMVVWREIWSIMTSLFIQFGQSENIDIARNILNVIQSLSTPFLQKEETSKMHHKGAFLITYCEIFDSQENMEVRMYILDIVRYLIEKFGDKLQSGWEAIMQVLIGSAQQPELIAKALEIFQEVVIKHFIYIKDYRYEYLFTAFVLFVMKDNKDKSALQVVGLLPIIADALTSKDEDIWIILLTTMQRCLKNTSNEVRSTIENSLVSIIAKHGFKHTEVIETRPELEKKPSQTINYSLSVNESSELSLESSEIFTESKDNLNDTEPLPETEPEPVHEEEKNDVTVISTDEVPDENGMIKKVVEIEAGINHNVWIEFLTHFLFEVFSFSEPSKVLHLVDLLKYIYKSIFEKFAPQLTCYAKEILLFLIHCAKDTKNLEMRHASLSCIESFVYNNAKAFDNEELSTALLQLFDEIAPELVDSVLGVEVLSSIIDIFSGDYKPQQQQQEKQEENVVDDDKYVNMELANKFITILGKVSDCCSKERAKEGVLATWCTARDLYFKCIVRQNREDEVVENLNESLEFYDSLRHNGTYFSGWDKLIAHKIKATANMDIGLFEKCLKKSTELFCNLVEVDDDEVRKELVPLLKRQLQAVDE